MNTRKKNILYFLNPSSNEGYGTKLWQQLYKKYSFLPKDPININSVNISELIAERNPEIIAIAGGDGTINAVCSSIASLKNKPLLAVLPFGFGNALAYCFGVETLEKSIVALQRQEYTMTIDVMKTNIPGAPIGLFNIGIGFEARIVHNRMKDRYIGFRSYIISAVKSYVLHRKNELIVTIDHAVTLRAIASSLVVAKCPIVGKRFLISPFAKLDDGLLDCTLFSTHYAYLTNLRLKGFKHPLYSKEGKTYFKAKHIRIEGDPLVQVDGDPLLHKEGIDIEVCPKYFTFLTNKTNEVDQFDLT